MNDGLFIFARTEQNTNGGVFVQFAHVAVKGFEIEVQFAQILRLEPADLEFDGHQAVDAAMEEKQVEREISAAHLHGIFRTDKAKIAPEFDREGLKFSA